MDLRQFQIVPCQANPGLKDILRVQILNLEDVIYKARPVVGRSEDFSSIMVLVPASAVLLDVARVVGGLKWSAVQHISNRKSFILRGVQPKVVITIDVARV